jgi:CheY-like chemotaxis protein
MTVDLHVELDEAGVTVEVEVAAVEQVLLNLVTNARDAVGSTGTVTLWVDTVEQRGVQVARLAMTDDGVGMSGEVRERALEPFFTTKEVGRGTGLGLAIVQDVATRAGGSVRITSRPDEGTTVEVFIPLSDRRPDPTTRELETLVDPGDGTILVVDDEPTILKTIQAALEAEGYSVQTARNGGHAIAVWRRMEVKPDLLLTDVAMPEMDGVELARHLQKRQPGLKVLLMSGYGDRVLARHGESPEDVALLNKPFRLATVLRRVAQSLAE